VTYAGEVERTGSTGAVYYKYYTDAECTKAIAATSVVKPGTYYVVAIVAADANYKAAKSAPAKLTITVATKGESTIRISDYSAPYTGKAVTYAGEVERTGSTGAVYYKYYTDAECTNAISANKVIKPRTYYVVAILAADADYKAAKSAPARLVVTKGESSIELSNYTTAYTGKPVAYAGQVKKTGSTGAVVYHYFSDAACTKEVASSKVIKAGKYYVKASLLPDSNYEAATSNVAVMTIDASLSPEVNPGGTTTYSSWDDVPANNFKKEVIGLNYNGQHIYGIAYIPKLGMQKYPLVICSHGINGNHTTCREFAAKLASHGIAAYCFDFRGAPDSQSDGNWEDTTISTEVEDLQTVIAAAKQWDFVDSSKIILYGICQGSTVSAITAARNATDVYGLILLYPSFMAHDYVHMQWNSLDEVPDVVTTEWFRVGKPYVVDVWDYDCYDEIGNYTKPVLLMHGDKDTKVPIAYSNRAAKVYPDVDYFVIKGADHGFAGQHRVEADQHILDYLIKLKIY
ncbi:MAG: alpha/beta fold hydrolase, partial [Atopobiaceae bacterium]|nr:alpha/beta fold hydrolase [Atopobiaceae bacterium]